MKQGSGRCGSRQRRGCTAFECNRWLEVRVPTRAARSDLHGVWQQGGAPGGRRCSSSEGQAFLQQMQPRGQAVPTAEDLLRKSACFSCIGDTCKSAGAQPNIL